MKRSIKCWKFMRTRNDVSGVIDKSLVAARQRSVKEISMSA